MLKKRVGILPYAGIFAFYLAVSAPALFKGLGTFDEGQFCFAGMKVAGGAVPYRDFFLRWTPGSPYLHALIFEVFGYEVVYARAAALAVDAFTLFLILLIISPAGRGVAAAVGLSYAFWGYIQCSYLWTTRLAIFFAITATAIMSAGERGKGPASHLAAGAACGLSFMFKQNIGFFAFAALLMFIAAESLVKRLCRGSSSLQTENPLRKTFFNIIFAVAGFAVIFFAAIIFFHAHDALGAFLDSIFGVAFRTEKAYFRPPNPFLGKLTFPVYFFGLGAIAISLRRAFFVGNYDERNARLPLAGIMMISTYYAALLSGSDFTHVALAVPCMFVVMGIFFGAVFESIAENKQSRVLSVCAVALLVSTAVALAAAGAVRSRQNACTAYEWEERTTQTELLGLPRARHIRVSPERKTAYTGIFNAVNSAARPGDCVFVYPYDVMFNFLLGRDNCSPFAELYHDSLSAHRADLIVQLLERRRVRFVILKNREMQMTHSLHGLPLYHLYPGIYDYVEGNYALEGQYLYWKVYVRK